jgi:hypothetical protein
LGNRTSLAKVALWAACASTAAGCGYSVGGLIARDTAVSLPHFDNLSERREHEFSLHRAVARELQARGVKIDEAAPLVMRGKILDITEPVRVEGESDQPIVAAVSYRVEITLVNRSDGREISKQVLEEAVSFSQGRLENSETARQAVIDRLARRVVSLLEKEL